MSFDKTKIRMVTGTEGNKDYVLLAVKQGAMLSFKPNVIQAGSSMGVPDTVYFGSKLRSAPFKASTFPELDQASVMPLAFKGTGKLSVWPGVVWSAEDSERCSTQIGVLIPGNVEKDADTLFASVSNKVLATKAADYLLNIAGDTFSVVDRSVLINWIDDFYAPVYDKILAAKKKQAEFSSKLKESVGMFGMQAAILKGIYESKQDVSDAQQAANAALGGNHAGFPKSDDQDDEMDLYDEGDEDEDDEDKPAS
jgi:hypothetical protein